MKRELSKKAKLSIFKAVFVPILTYGHESWVMTERMRSQVQASEMRFLRRIEVVTLFNKVRSSEIRKSLNIEPLLLRIERSQLRWFGHVSRMPQERLPKQALHAKANGRRPVGRPRTRWTDYIDDLGWNRLGLRPSEMMEVMEDREVWRLNLELLPPQPSRKSGQWRKKKKKKILWSGWKIFWKTFFSGDRLKNFCEDLFFFLESTCALCPWSLALASSIPVLGLESVCPRKGCPWPLASDFFCVLGLGLEPCVLDSTSDKYPTTTIFIISSIVW